MVMACNATPIFWFLMRSLSSRNAIESISCSADVYALCSSLSAAGAQGRMPNATALFISLYSNSKQQLSLLAHAMAMVVSLALVCFHSKINNKNSSCLLVSVFLCFSSYTIFVERRAFHCTQNSVWFEQLLKQVATGKEIIVNESQL